ncbi:PhyH-domain-containing protein [Microthyrium microscopicum]|uniref:PhyH-domain-containing protein n=1 Tax=Microthyrium microscopicum TaxID=703497 RepID=A0A6A6TWQ4_9PEZI|nr:PhyH-domain-containing protein [Microthyrium microscopicum]
MAEAKHITTYEKSDGDLGPLMALLLANQNNNNSDILAADSIALELKTAVPEPQTVAIEDDQRAENLDMESDDDGPLLFALLLNNQNNNNNPNANPSANNSDILATQTVALELKGEELTANPILRLRGEASAKCRGGLDQEQLQFWKNYGYLVIPDALSAETTLALLQNVHDTAKAMAVGGDQVQMHLYVPGQESYVSPVGRALATLTKHAFNPEAEPLQRIQRLGCGVHRVMPAFRKTVLDPFHGDIAKSLGYKDPRVTQSLVIVKAAEVGARVIPHQDGCSGFTDPPSCATFWYALEDTTIENGCLQVAPGSHRSQPLTRRCKRDDTGKAEFVELDTPVFAKIDGTTDDTVPKRDDNGGYVYEKLEVKAGTLILMHGNIMHTSSANESRKSRVAFNFGIVEGTHDWKKDAYLQPYEGQMEFEKLPSSK